MVFFYILIIKDNTITLNNVVWIYHLQRKKNLAIYYIINNAGFKYHISWNCTLSQIVAGAVVERDNISYVYVN